MNKFLNQISTPLTFALFAISAVSGAALFFHWQPRAFHSMHEWLSMVLLAPFVFHMWKNWRPFMVYVKRGALIAPLVVSIVAAAAFAWSAGAGGGRGPGPRASGQAIEMLTHAALGDLAPVLGVSDEEMQAQLAQFDVAVYARTATLAEIAEGTGVPEQRLLGALIALRAPENDASHAVQEGAL